MGERGRLGRISTLHVRIEDRLHAIVSSPGPIYPKSNSTNMSPQVVVTSVSSAGLQAYLAEIVSKWPQVRAATVNAMAVIRPAWDAASLRPRGWPPADPAPVRASRGC